MRRHLASPAIIGAVVASCISLGALTAVAQTPASVPAATPTAASTPAPTATPAAATVSPKPPKATGKAATPQPSRKYDRSYKHCKMRALRRGLKGVERRAFIRRCELGFAPPRVRIAPDTQPVIVPGTGLPATPGPTPGPATPPARK